MRAEEISLAALDDPALAGLFAGAPFQSRPGWWRAVAAAGLPDGAQARFWVVRDGARPVGFWALCQDGEGQGGGRWRALDTPYTTLWQPLLATDADPAGIGHALGRACPAGRLVLAPLDGDAGVWTGLRRGLRRAGLVSLGFDTFGNWHERVAGRGWAGYLADRPGALRETLRRRLGRAERDPDIEIHLARDPDDAAAVLVEYEAVHARSWKQPEPHPRFAAAFVAEAAAAGVLRLAVLRRAGVALAAQYWTVEPAPGGAVASVLKLAYDEAARALSPGTVLTGWMIRRLIEQDGVAELDFGRGDDPYKQLWVSARRQRGGLLLARPWRVQGAQALVRQIAGAGLRRLRAGRVAS